MLGHSTRSWVTFSESPLWTIPQCICCLGLKTGPCLAHFCFPYSTKHRAWHSVLSGVLFLSCDALFPITCPSSVKGNTQRIGWKKLFPYLFVFNLNANSCSCGALQFRQHFHNHRLICIPPIRPLCSFRKGCMFTAQC